jgi:hypothetical protein
VHAATGAMTEAQLVAALQALPQDGPVLLGIRSKTRVTRAVIEAVPQLLGGRGVLHRHRPGRPGGGAERRGSGVQRAV